MFQLTTSRRGRRRGGHPVRTSGGFNSRPHEEVDMCTSALRAACRCFNSRPHEEVDQGDGPDRKQIIVSTHDLTKRSTERQRTQASEKQRFNSRPHEEVDTIETRLLLTLFSFNSRPHEEVDASFPLYEDAFSLFQLTTSRRGRPYTVGSETEHRCFNSRPHEEVDEG